MTNHAFHCGSSTGDLDEEETLQPASAKRTAPVSQSGMSSAAFQGKDAMYTVDQSGRIHRSEIKHGRLTAARHVGSVPIHCENAKLAVATNALFFLVPDCEDQPSQLLLAPLDSYGNVGRWTPLPLPCSDYSFRRIWVEEARVFVLAEGKHKPIIFSARLCERAGIQEWDRFADLPPNTHVESTVTAGQRCYIASRSEGTGMVDLLSVSLDKSRIVSRVGRIKEVKGDTSLVCGTDRMILLDGGDLPGRAQIHVAQLAADGTLSRWSHHSAEFHAVLNSACGIVLDDRVLFAGRNGSGHGRRISISSYSTRLPKAS